MHIKTILTGILLFYFFISCNSSEKDSKKNKIAFLDAFQDETISQAKKGFIDALNESGYSEKNQNLVIIYKNAQGSIPVLNQEINYLLNQNVRFIATNTTLATISTAQRTRTIPIFMMVSSSPEMAGLVDKNKKAPANLLGVYEDLNYIDTSILLVKQILPFVKTIGAIYSQGEPQSAQAFEHLKQGCKSVGVELISLPVNNSSETQLIVQSLLSRHIDAFFALPDNSIFSSFEAIKKSCDQARVPIFTSEEGLVKRGAVAAFGADIYGWGHQSGLSAVKYLKYGKTGMAPELVKERRKVYNKMEADKFKFTIPKGIIAVKE